MHVGLDVMCMHTNFGGHGLSSVGDIATFKFGKFGYFQFSLLYIIINYYKWYGNAVSWLYHMHSPLKERTDRKELKYSIRQSGRDKRLKETVDWDHTH